MAVPVPLEVLPSAEAALAWLAARGVRALAIDSRRVQPGDAFIAWPGHAVDARGFVAAALGAGAVAALVEADGIEAFDLPAGGAVAAVRGLKAATGLIASAFEQVPSARLSVIAVTGTNGKTSTSWWTAQALTALGRRCGIVGTLGVGEPSAGVVATGLTTPDPITLQRAFRQFVDGGFQACAIEASSIGLVEERLAGTRIAVAQFTNFTQDHLDFHGDMQAYWRAKLRLLDAPGLQAVVVNVDDAHGAAWAEAQPADGPVDLWTYAVGGHARLRATELVHGDGGLAFTLHEGEASAMVNTQLIGGYNASNLLAVIGAMRALGVPLADAAEVCSVLTPVPGRMQRIQAEGVHGEGVRDESALPQVVVDYAHTPDALEKALLALQPFAAARGGQLWCVFGCGGNRDAAKRPLMGALAQRLAKHVVVTTDNPRFEAPAFINLQIIAGLPGSQAGVKVIADRRAAIAHAIRAADARDVILIAGKGHEDYQEIAGVKHPFSDADEARAALALRVGVSS